VTSRRVLAVRRLSGRSSDPLLAAAVLVDRYGLAVLASREPNAAYGRFSFVAAEPDAEVTSIDPFAGGPAESDAGPFGFAPRFIGVVPFEARRPALERPAWSKPDTRPKPALTAVRWLRYPAVVVFDHARDEVHVVGESDGAARDLETRVVGAASSLGPRAAFRLQVGCAEDDAAHITRVARAIELIRAGDLYQVNVARRLDLTLTNARGGRPGPMETLAVFAALVDGAPSPFGAFLAMPDGARVLSTSPELALAADRGPGGASFGALVTEPIKGTRPRGADAAADARLAAELDADPKERAELAMIVDVERNDLARVCARGSVEVAGPPRVVTHATVHHRVAVVRGLARPDVSREEVLEALLPSGSVTGAPKVRAMEVIAALESARRGLYTGALGYAGWDGSMRLAMAIRTAVLEPSGAGAYGVGGGIVVDSDPRRELEETLWKSLQLQRIIHPEPA